MSTAAAIRPGLLYRFIRISWRLEAEVESEREVRRGRRGLEVIRHVERTIARLGIDARVVRPHVEVAGGERQARRLRAEQPRGDVRRCGVRHRQLAPTDALPAPHEAGLGTGSVVAQR